MHSLTSAPRLIHISDLHLTDNDSTWDLGYPLWRDVQDSDQKIAILTEFLRSRKDDFGTIDVVITGDLTDSGDEADYDKACAFIGQLVQEGFSVSAAPGNHDYCWEGNFFFEDIFSAAQEFIATAVVAEIGTQVGWELAWSTASTIFFGFPLSPPRPPPGATMMTVLDGMIKAKIAGVLAASNAYSAIPSFVIDMLVSDVLTLFVMSGATLVALPDAVDNQTRRNRFNQRIGAGRSDYPRQVPVSGGAVIVVDSVAGQLDEPPRALLAQGRIGSNQRNKLANMISNYQTERERGKRLVVCLHHSPLHVTSPEEPGPPLQHDSACGLEDAQDFWEIVRRDQIDGLLYGHTTPKADIHQQPRLPTKIAAGDRDEDFSTAEQTYHVPVLNCENLEHLESGPWSVTVVDTGSGRRATYDARYPNDPPDITWGTYPPAP